MTPELINFAVNSFAEYISLALGIVCGYLFISGLEIKVVGHD